MDMKWDYRIISFFTNSSSAPNIDPSWLEVLQEEFEKPYFNELKAFIVNDIESGQTVYPSPDKIFNAFDKCLFNQVKVVILGQDPYHGPNQAHGLCFSVNKNVAIPPSLQNIYKELHDDLGCDIPSHGNLESWAEQGVLLLNATLTVRRGQATSHAGKGWEVFTDRVIKELNDRREGIVFLLWGRYAQDKGAIIDVERHYVLKAAHPSPFSVSKFYGCQHFSKANQILEFAGDEGIEWQIL